MLNLILEGECVYLEEVQAKHFPNTIEWRYNTDNNRFLNQPFKLIIEMQNRWYEEKYSTDISQGLFVIVDKQSDKAFGTIGWTDYSSGYNACIGERLLISEQKY